MAIRRIKQVIQSQPSSDGDGVKIQRVPGFNNTNFSPYLMIDELKSVSPDDYIGGFPAHPHRGIETLTYMLNGHFQHKDHMGNVGELRDGGAQWMSAGKGVIHSEMPMMTDGSLHGFQIWINLPAAKKMLPAQYTDFQPEMITEKAIGPNNLVRLISGELTINGDIIKGPLQKTGVPATIADWQASKGEKFDSSLNPDFQAMLYVYKGTIEVEGKIVKSGQLALLDQGEELSIKNTEDSGMLLLSGIPIDEPVVHYGPFVMNSIEEIEQAIRDYQQDKLV